MSWSTARTKLAAILSEDVIGLSTARGLPGTLTEDTDGAWDAPLAAGRFRIRCVASAFESWSSPGQSRFTKQVQIKRGYGGTWKDRAEADRAMWDDEAAVVDALRDTANWEAASSTIIQLSDGGPTMLEADVEPESFAVVTTVVVKHY